MAVNRRQQENNTFSDIAHTLPIEENAKELDKASILRIAIHYLRLRDILADCEPENDLGDLIGVDDQSSLPNFSKDVLQALDGFMLLISRDGKVLFASESISHYLGLRQVDVIGIDLKDIIHPQDFMDVAAIFQSQGHDVGPDIEALLGNNHRRRNFVARMRCAFTPSVRSVTRCSNFKPIYCSAFLKFSNKKIKEGEFLGMVVLCKLASVMKVKELCVGAYFKTKHALDLSYTAIDTRIRWILGFDPAKMVGEKAYNYFHPEDLLATSSCHTNLLSQGHSHSPCYRFMAQSGDWVWVRSKSCVTHDPVTHLPNGLSIYTWIIRYDEEDERMKAIVEGKDPGMFGIKDTSTMTLPNNMKVEELCNPTSKPIMSSKKSVITPNTNTSSSNTSSPHSYTSLSPQSYTSSHSPSISPDNSTIPPNVNPFQFQSGVDGSPTSSIASVQSYDISSPKTATTVLGPDPFMGIATFPQNTNVGYNNSLTTSTMNTNHYKLTNIKQSSIDSNETSPPHSISSAASVYCYSIPSPDNNSPGSGNESHHSQYQQHHQTFSDVYNVNSALQQHSPPHYGAHSPYDNNSSTYSPDNGSIGGGSPLDAQVNLGLYSVQDSMSLFPSQNYVTPMELSTAILPQCHLGTQNIKQEVYAYDAQCYGNLPHDQSLQSNMVQKMSRNVSYVSQAKARYSTIAVGSKSFQHTHKKSTQEDAAILGISKWLQQGGRTPVH